MRIKLDKEEQALYKSLQKGEWQSIPDFEDYKCHLQKIAKTTMNKTQRINLRLTPKDVEAARIRGIREGLPYQTLLASIVHKYLTGMLVDSTQTRKSA